MPDLDSDSTHIQCAVATLASPRGNEQRVLAGRGVRNSILLRLPQAEFDSLKLHLQFVFLRSGATLERQYEPIHAAYFINQGIVSKIIEMEDGRSVEVGMAGREHMVGLQLAVGLDNLMHTLVVQVPGEGFRISVMTLRWALKSLPELTRILTRRLGIQSVQFARNAACNRLHGVKQRLSRWLLMTFDRLDFDVFYTTHDFLSRMVGSDRPSVSIALAELERHGMILAGRGAIWLVDRSKLEQQSCECYAVFKQFNAELGLE
jgi:CRP-like cAMP-binding protein